MKKLMTKSEFIKVMDSLFYEGYFITSQLLEVELESIFNNDFTYAISITINNNLYVVRKRENTANTYELFSVK